MISYLLEIVVVVSIPVWLSVGLLQPLPQAIAAYVYPSFQP
jgi:hypothetical protein